MTDFIIVGRGLSAGVLMHYCAAHNITFKVIGVHELSRSSLVAAGIWNPVVFKRMTKSWRAEEFTDELFRFYPEAERGMNTKIFHPRHIIRAFNQAQEVELWKKKAGDELDLFLDPEIYSDHGGLHGCMINGGYGIVKRAGNLDVRGFIAGTEEKYREHITEEVFDHSQLQLENDKVKYKQHLASDIVFCEGYRVSENPFFKWVPLNPAKGEILTITSDVETGGRIFNRNGFLLPVGDRKFRVGATFSWGEMTETETVAGGAELQAKTKAMISTNYEVVRQEAGIRPATLDLRPVVGQHPRFARLWVFNGLGAKGVMIAPFLAKNFVHFYLKKEPLVREADVKRYYHLYGG
jgi:glycine oxidase